MSVPLGSSFRKHEVLIKIAASLTKDNFLQMGGILRTLSASVVPVQSFITASQKLLDVRGQPQNMFYQAQQTFTLFGSR